MPIQFIPPTGTILRCDFTGFRAPEMVKPRPVVVISPRPERAGKGTCIVVALSTTKPEPVHRFHLRVVLPGDPPPHLEKECWVKGDMIYSVSFARLDLYRTGKHASGKRQYYYDRLSKEDIIRVRKAAAYAIGITHTE